MKNTYFYLIHIAWKFAKGRRFHFILAYVLFVVANLITLINPIIIGLFFNNLQTNGIENYKNALLILTAYPVLSLLFWVFHGTARIVERVNTYHIVKNFREDLFDTLTALPLKWHKDNHSGEIMSRVEKASNSMQSFVDEGFMYLETLVKFVGSTIALFVISFYSGLIALVFGVISIAIIFRFDKLLVKYMKTINEKAHIYDATFYDYVVNMRTVITLRLEKLAKKETSNKFSKVFPIWKKNAKVNEVKWFLLSMIISFLTFAIIAFYLFQQVSAGEALLIGTLVILYEYVNKYTEVFFDLAWKYENLVRARTDIKSLDKIWQASKKFGTMTKIAPISDKWKTLEIKELTFKYEDEKHRTHNLKDINLKIKRGERIAFVGESGSGKSTLMTLLRGLQEPNKVKIFVDKVQVKGLRSLSSSVTLIPQDPEIFENTIEYNITAGIHHKKSDITESIKAARFEEVVKRLAKGIKTNIKEKGVNLSGGEKQRLALSRGVFAAKHSSLILLDEPTSSVDPANEIKIYDNLFKKFKNSTIISSIHRLHLLPKFDKIYFFKNGQITATGSLNELITNNKDFKKVWDIYQESAGGKGV